MAVTRLVIRREQVNKIGKCTIYATYTHQKCIYFSCKAQIEPNFWDSDKCIVTKDYPGHYLLNHFLLKTKNEIEQIRLKLELLGIEPSPLHVRKEYLKIKPEKQETKEFHQCKDEFLQYKKDTQRVSASTIDQLKTFFKQLDTFQKWTGKKISFEQINERLYERLLCFYYDECGYSPNTVSSKIKHLKTFLNWCGNRGYHTIKSLKMLKKPCFQPEIIYLTQAELNILVTYNFSDNPRLERARDLFIFACATGLRYSDLVSLGPENFVGDYLLIRTRKTHDTLKIPLNDYTRFIIKKYQGKLPTLSNHRLNLYIKEAAKIAELNNLREITTMRGGKKITSALPLHRLIRSHLARKTFISLSLEKGMTLKDVAAITGHKGQSIERYIASSEKRLTDQMNQYWKIE